MIFDQVQRPNDLVPHLVSLLYKELIKIVLVKNNGSVFLLLVHQTKIRIVALK